MTAIKRIASACLLGLLVATDARLSAALAQKDNAILPGGSSKEPVSIVSLADIKHSIAKIDNAPASTGAGGRDPYTSGVLGEEAV